MRYGYRTEATQAVKECFKRKHYLLYNKLIK
jgi:hypothetical protein